MYFFQYEALLAKSISSEGGEQKSQAYYVLKAAQEKEELQRLGDEWDEKVNRAEEDLRQVDKSLVDVIDWNGGYKQSVRGHGPNTALVEEATQLELQLKAANDVIFRRKVREK